MILVLNPNLYLKGKLFLKYNGNNVSLLQADTKIHYIKIFGYHFDNLTESLLFNFRLHHNLEIALSLTSPVIYVENKSGWIEHENSLFSITDILVDNSQTFIKGVLSFCNVIDENNRYIEPYSFDLIFHTTETFINRLKSDGLNVTDFRINLN